MIAKSDWQVVCSQHLNIHKQQRKKQNAEKRMLDISFDLYKLEPRPINTS